jgi:hypothetical protein
MEENEQRNWEYGDLRLRAENYVLGAGAGMQPISLRGHLLLDIVVTQLLLANVSGPPALTRMPFGRKLKTAVNYGLISPEISSIISAVARIRNAHVHELGLHATFRQVNALWVRALNAGVEHRFSSLHDEAQAAERVEAMGELADRLFSPTSELVDLCVELFSHIVFWNYDALEVTKVGRTLDEMTLA